jgi:hypothetical protein
MMNRGWPRQVLQYTSLQCAWMRQQMGYGSLKADSAAWQLLYSGSVDSHNEIWRRCASPWCLQCVLAAVCVDCTATACV